MPIAILDWHSKASKVIGRENTQKNRAFLDANRGSQKRQKLLDVKTLKKFERFWMLIAVPDWHPKTAEIIGRENAQKS